MAITLDGMFRNAEQGQKAGVSVSLKADLATGALDLPSQRVGQQLNATNVQLSVYGQVKSSFVEVQSAGRTLSTPAKIGTVEDATKAVQDFADAYNNAARVTDAAGKADGNKPAILLAGSGYANLAGSDLKKVVAGGSNAADLQRIGISMNQDGTLSVDAKTLQNAMQANPAPVQDTLAKVGAQAVQMSQKELSGAGNTGGALNTPGVRARGLEAKASGLQESASDLPDAIPQQTSNIGGRAAGGIAAYMRMLSF